VNTIAKYQMKVGDWQPISREKGTEILERRFDEVAAQYASGIQIVESPSKYNDDPSLQNTNTKFLKHYNSDTEYLHEGGEGIEMKNMGGNPKLNEVQHDMKRLKHLKKCSKMSACSLLNKAIQEVTFSSLTIVAEKVESHSHDLDFVDDKI